PALARLGEVPGAFPQDGDRALPLRLPPRHGGLLARLPASRRFFRPRHFVVAPLHRPPRRLRCRGHRLDLLLRKIARDAAARTPPPRSPARLPRRSPPHPRPTGPLLH